MRLHLKWYEQERPVKIQKQKKMKNFACVSKHTCFVSRELIYNLVIFKKLLIIFFHKHFIEQK